MVNFFTHAECCIVYHTLNTMWRVDLYEHTNSGMSCKIFKGFLHTSGEAVPAKGDKTALGRGRVGCGVYGSLVVGLVRMKVVNSECTLIHLRWIFFTLSPALLFLFPPPFILFPTTLDIFLRFILVFFRNMRPMTIIMLEKTKRYIFHVNYAIVKIKCRGA